MGGGKPQQKVDLKEVKEKQALARSQMLRGAFGFLTEGAFRQRKAYFTAKVGPHCRLSCHACLQKPLSQSSSCRKPPSLS